MSADNDREKSIVDGSGNVFKDLGLPHSEEDLVKAQIALAITNTLRKRGLTQADAAKLIGTDQAKISAILRGRLKGMSTYRLVSYLARLGRDVEVRISDQSAIGRPGKIRVFG
jgi:predicted XRE-type DNA-binding protein